MLSNIIVLTRKNSLYVVFKSKFNDLIPKSLQCNPCNAALAPPAHPPTNKVTDLLTIKFWSKKPIIGENWLYLAVKAQTVCLCGPLPTPSSLPRTFHLRLLVHLYAASVFAGIRSQRDQKLEGCCSHGI